MNITFIPIERSLPNNAIPVELLDALLKPYMKRLGLKNQRGNIRNILEYDAEEFRQLPDQLIARLRILQDLNSTAGIKYIVSTITNRGKFSILKDLERCTSTEDRLAFLINTYIYHDDIFNEAAWLYYLSRKFKLDEIGTDPYNSGNFGSFELTGIIPEIENSYLNAYSNIWCSTVAYSDSRFSGYHIHFGSKRFGSNNLADLLTSKPLKHYSQAGKSIIDVFSIVEKNRESSFQTINDLQTAPLNRIVNKGRTKTIFRNDFTHDHSVDIIVFDKIEPNIFVSISSKALITKLINIFTNSFWKNQTDIVRYVNTNYYNDNTGILQPTKLKDAG